MPFSRASLFLCLAIPACCLAIQPPPPAPKPATPPSPAAATPIQPTAPKPIPVPDGPVVNKQELEGGLIAEDLKIGEGPEVKPGATCVLYYHGTLKADPSVVFDSAFDRGEPVTYPLTMMIQGWQKGVPGMKPGGVRRLMVPAALAYGPQAKGNKIPANSDLVFVIQLEGAIAPEDIKTEDIKVGEGEEAGRLFVAVTAQTIRDADGKEVDKNDAAHPYIWIPGEMVIQALGIDVMQQGIGGMKVGGKRKITIPKLMNVSPSQFVSNRPQNVPITIEVDLIALRNLPQQPPRGR